MAGTNMGLRRSSRPRPLQSLFEAKVEDGPQPSKPSTKNEQVLPIVAAHRFGASVPASHHPPAHPGALTQRPTRSAAVHMFSRSTSGRIEGARTTVPVSATSPSNAAAISSASSSSSDSKPSPAQQGTIERLGDLMAIMGPRYKVLPRGAGWELASLWSQETLLQRRLRERDEMVSTSPAGDALVKGSRAHLGSNGRTTGHRSAPDGSDGQSTGVFFVPRAKGSLRRMPSEPGLSTSSPGVSSAVAASSPDLFATWHGKPLGPSGRPGVSPGQSFNRFAAQNPISHHPPVHPGAVSGRV